MQQQITSMSEVVSSLSTYLRQQQAPRAHLQGQLSSMQQRFFIDEGLEWSDKQSASVIDSEQSQNQN